MRQELCKLKRRLKSRSTNFLEINCRKRLAGGNGRAYDRIGENFETRQQSKYFREFIRIADDGLGQPYETSPETQLTYLLRMGTIHHEIYHNWSYDHKRHGHDTYRRSMNQVARHALQDSFRDNWLEKTSTPGCFRLRRCRLHGYLLLRDTQGNPYLGYDPARTGFGILGYRYPGASDLESRKLSLWDAALFGNSYSVRRLDGQDPQPTLSVWRPAPTDQVLAVANKRRSVVPRPNLNEFVVLTDEDFKVIAWGGARATPDFFVKSSVPFGAAVPLLRGDQPTGIQLSRGTQFLAYDSRGRNQIFVQRSPSEILNITSETTGFKLNYGLAVGMRVPHRNSDERTYLDGQLRFLGQMDIAANTIPAVLIGTESKLLLLQPDGNGRVAVIATYRGEAWSGPSRWDSETKERRPPIAGNFLGNDTDEMLLANDSGLSLLSYSTNGLRVAGQLRFGNAFDGFRFNEFYWVTEFGKYANLNRKEAVVFSRAGFLRVVFFNESGNPQVFARVDGTPPEPDTITGTTTHTREAWIYDQARDVPVIAADMTGDDQSEIVLVRRNPQNASQIDGLGILSTAGSPPSRTVGFRDYRYTGCFGREACHEGAFGHWLLRKDDKPVGFLYDNDTGKALMLTQNRRAL